MMDHFVKQAIFLARKGFGKKLDFSVKSLNMVEEILEELHKEFLKTNDDKGMYGIALFFGAYIGAVIKNELGLGGWKQDHPDFGHKSYPFHIKEGNCVFPVSWCYKRIMDGEGDNIVVKYQALIEVD